MEIKWGELLDAPIVGPSTLSSVPQNGSGMADEVGDFAFEYQFVFGISEIGADPSDDPAVIPLPASARLLLGGSAALGILRARRA